MGATHIGFLNQSPAVVCDTSKPMHTKWQHRMLPFGVCGNSLSRNVHCQMPITVRLAVAVPLAT